MDLKQFKKQPLLGILRGVEADIVEPLIEEVAQTGLKAIEITMNTPNASKLIEKAVKAADGKMDIGAGTVTSMYSMQEALGAGANFLVMPTLIISIVEYCIYNDIPVFPGAMTPKEVLDAWKAGATMVKIFPLKQLGPQYLKELKGPFDDIKLMACGGVTPGNIEEHFSCGASAVAFGGSVFKKELLDNKDISSIKDTVQQYVDMTNAVFSEK
ncbi:bifunctional 4-hydroxy-2-oxoglutarate aldolase/2-dehydro-3-deoxy-phosphogluconate aldolase [Elusimicrobiota bacterium]